MKWTEGEAEQLGLHVNVSRYAMFRYNEVVRVRGHGTVIDLLEGKLVANNGMDDHLVEALNFPRFETLKELLVWLRLQT